MIALSQEAQRAADLGVAAAIALAGWLLLLGLLALATRPRLPQAAPATSDLAGPESPAVVSLLVNRWEVGREAVPATLLDLAARKALDVERVSPERYAVRLRRTVPPDLTDYERQVLDHVRSLASDHGVQATQAGHGVQATQAGHGVQATQAGHGVQATQAGHGVQATQAGHGVRATQAGHGVRATQAGHVVPCEALTTGPDEQSSGWWRRFQKAVVADARHQGLTRPRWGAPAVIVLGIAAVAPASLAAAAVVSIPESPSSTSSSEDDNPVVGALALGAVAWSALMVVPFWLRAERDTPKGRKVAAGWLGVQEYLDESESFDRAPPTAVAIWDRYLAYGAAMGVAAGAVRALPLGSESDREAWSAYGGHWHVVRVRYPSKIPPGWGRKPIVVAAKALLLLAAAAFVVTRLGSPLTGAVRDFVDMARENNWKLAATIGVAVVGVVLALVTAVLLRAAVMLAFGVVDLFAKQTVEGLVIRLRDGYVAVDDGRSRSVRAWRVEPAKLGAAARGVVVRATVSPRLGYVFSLERAGARPRQAGLADAPVDEQGGKANA